MTYTRPDYVKTIILPKRGRTEYRRVEGFLSKEEAQEYADWYYQANWGYGPFTKVSQHADGTWNVDIDQMDSCD